jgi:hypothetical protein
MLRGNLLLIWPIAACLLLTPGASVLAQTSDQEYQLKAAYLYNFGRYIDWPKKGAAGDDRTFIIGVLGQDPFGPHLDAIAAGRMIQNKKVVVRRFASAKDYQPCHILFVSGQAAENAEEKTVEARMKAAVLKTKGAPVLLVSDVSGFAQKGMTIAFNVSAEENQLKLEINQSGAERAGLKIRAALLGLKVVTIVKDSE